MPTSSLRPLQMNIPVQGLFVPPSYRPNDVLIGPWSRNAIGHELTGMAANNFASAAYPAANRIIAYPFEIANYFLPVKFWMVLGTTSSGNCSIAVYKEDGTFVDGLGGWSSVLTNAVNEASTSLIELPPGRYWCGYYQSGTTQTPLASATPAVLLRAAGCAQMAGSGTITDNFVPAAIASAYMPLFGIAGRTQVA